MAIAVYGGRTERAVQKYLAQQKLMGRVGPEVCDGKLINEQRRKAEEILAAIKEAERRKAERFNQQRDEANRAIAQANRALRRYNKTNSLDFATIQRRICKALGVSRDDLLFGSRKRNLVLARQAVCYWARRRTKLSLPEIGRRMGGKDHTTCMWAKNIYPTKRAKMGRFLREVR